VRIQIAVVVVVLFLGWRAGIIVGSIVPLTILGTLIAMRSLGVELQTVSMAAIIIATKRICGNKASLTNISCAGKASCNNSLAWLLPSTTKHKVCIGRVSA